MSAAIATAPVFSYSSISITPCVSSPTNTTRTRQKHGPAEGDLNPSFGSAGTTTTTTTSITTMTMTPSATASTGSDPTQTTNLSVTIFTSSSATKESLTSTTSEISSTTSVSPSSLPESFAIQLQASASPANSTGFSTSPSQQIAPITISLSSTVTPPILPTSVSTTLKTSSMPVTPQALTPSVSSVPRTTFFPISTSTMEPTPPASLFSNNSTISPFIPDPEKHGAGTRRILMIAVPTGIGTAALIVCLWWLWSRFCPASYNKFFDLFPSFGFLTTKPKKKAAQPGLLTGVRDGAPGDTYARHLRQYEEEAVRVREKYSFDTPSTPRTGNSISATRAGSPWWKPKIVIPSSHDISPGTGNNPRRYGPFRRNFNEKTGSLESWEEKWFALGSDVDVSAPSRPMMKTKDQTMNNGKDMDQSLGTVIGPGQSWRKLI
ncbi:uncharacterized protein Z518_00012 [Rhinocladiella mackenziei CBS 650.93]|uniref:Uncharacterized protein n=1 Tax=Rhinocladiella mackenziei CBS 650.93 TaxID=1442369 RepID=A0A0D2ISH5_9EURO|nr:uncharacterized protein Z518_00012 [Rhinocladiella mackenziei CBS 650.93]KIX08934.1 hypothetical protein Z518_00012 [Rhinocladiella mackenziei CBS 650.93]